MNREDLVVTELRKRIGALVPPFELQADFRVSAGERAALVGPSGSGKTTLLRALAGLEAIDGGAIRLGDCALHELPPRLRDIGFVFQDQALFSSMDVFGNILFPLKLRKMPSEEARELALGWLDRVDLRSHAHASIETLSGGERQRVAFVRALIWKPRLLLLDEPFSALDRELRSSLCRELVDLHALHPVPMVLVTHDELDVQSVANVRLLLRANPMPTPIKGSLIHRVERE